MLSIWANFNHVFKVFLGLFFAFLLLRKGALGMRLSFVFNMKGIWTNKHILTRLIFSSDGFKGNKSQQFISTKIYLYKQLGSGPCPQSSLYFQDFQGSKLLNGCIVVWSNKKIMCIPMIQIMYALDSNSKT